MNCRQLGIAFRSAVICAASAFALTALLALILCGTADPAPLLLPMSYIPLVLGAAAVGLLTARSWDGALWSGGLIGGGAYALLVLLTALCFLWSSSDNVHPDALKLALLMVLLLAASLFGAWLVGRRQKTVSAHSREDAVKRAVRRAGLSNR